MEDRPELDGPKPKMRSFLFVLRRCGSYAAPRRSSPSSSFAWLFWTGIDITLTIINYDFRADFYFSLFTNIPGLFVFVFLSFYRICLFVWFCENCMMDEQVDQNHAAVIAAPRPAIPAIVSAAIPAPLVLRSSTGRRATRWSCEYLLHNRVSSVDCISPLHYMISPETASSMFT